MMKENRKNQRQFDKSPSSLRFGFSGNSRTIKDVSVKVGQWWYIAFAAIGSAIISVAASFYAGYEGYDPVYCNPWSYAIILGIGLILYGGKGTFEDLSNLDKENKRLKEENAQVSELEQKLESASEDTNDLQNKLLELQIKLVETWLKGSSRQLKLETHERATIYYYVNKEFYLLARHSKNPLYAEVHRQKFPRNQGVISKAWQHGVHVDIDKCTPYSENSGEYKSYMHRVYGYDETKVDALCLKSCSFVAIAISEADKPIGVIVIESERKKAFSSQKVNQITSYCSTYQSYMVDFIKSAIRLDKSARAPHRQDIELELLNELKRTVGGKSE